MLIAKDSAVTIHFQLANTQGKVLEKSGQPLAYLHGGYGIIYPKIEAALDGQGAGYEVAVDLSPEDAFGVFDPALQQTIPKTQFPPGVNLRYQFKEEAQLTDFHRLGHDVHAEQVVENDVFVDEVAA